jgi:hypothetical protein
MAITELTPGLPRYVEFGGRATSPGPFLCAGGRLRGLILEGDLSLIEALVARTLSQPAAGAVEYRALDHHVLLLIGAFDRVSSTTPPYDDWGFVREVQVSLWIPVVAGSAEGTEFEADRLVLAVPYMLVDNPMSYLGGREDYGYAKTMGRFYPESLADHMRVEAFGGQFSKGADAGWRPLLEVAPGAPHGGGVLDRAVRGIGDLVSHLSHDLLHPNLDSEIVHLGYKLPVQLVKDTLAGRSRQLFLKQFRDSGDGTRACYQAVIEAPLQVRHASWKPSFREWDVTIHDLDSHPITAELGVASQTVPLAFDIDLEFVVDNGVEVGGGVGAFPKFGRTAEREPPAG